MLRLGRSWFEASLSKKVCETPSQGKKAGCGGTLVVLAVMGCINRKTEVQAGLGKKQEPMSKINRVE
jgi:hypothetical protein